MAERIQTTALHGCRLSVEFVRQSDRYAHVIQLIDGNVVHPLLLSAEGASADQWPHSPVLQQLHIEDRSDFLGRASRRDADTECHVALLVGMAGRSHWSLSVEPDDAAAALVFDVACRVHAENSHDLRSTYRLMVLPKLWEVGRCVFNLNDAWLITVKTESHPETNLHPSELGLNISPQQITGATRRWKYRVELSRV